jgi:hypothetical protein
MSQWIVSHVPSWLFLMVLVVGIAGGTVAVLAVVRRRFSGLAEGTQNEIAKVGFSVVGPVYGFLTGFIIVVLWGQIGAADVVVRTEGSSAVQMVRELDVFAKADGDRSRGRFGAPLRDLSGFCAIRRQAAKRSLALA